MPPTLILIRHAEGLHNVNSKTKRFITFVSVTNVSEEQYHIPDPGLSTLGVEQCRQLSEHLQTKQPLANQIELIVSSPMRRTLQTAMLSFDWLIARGIKIIPDANWQGIFNPSITHAALKNGRPVILISYRTLKQSL